MQRWSKPKRRRSISLTPLIDVVFLLLIFFVMAGRFSDEARLVLAAPAIDGAAPSETAPSLMLVQVDAAGDLLLMGQVIDATRLAAAQPDDASIVLRLHPELPLAGMVAVIDRLKAAGIERLSYWPENAP